MSMMADAISHAVLPGLAIAFLVSGTRAGWPLFLGAVVTGLLTALFTQWVHRSAGVDRGAAMGVVFTTLFAIGLVIIVRAADHVDLDPGCVLYGAIEFTPLDTVKIAGHFIPQAVLVNGGVLLANVLLIVSFYKELVLSSFDADLADTLGFRPGGLHYLLMMQVAATTVAAFESVGSIIVIAMFIVPAATARLLTDRLPVMLVFSVIAAALAAALGHWGALEMPRLFGLGATNTSGMMAAAAGLVFGFAMIVSRLRLRRGGEAKKLVKL